MGNLKIREPRGWTARPARRAFTLVDVLVSMAVVAVLIGLLLPSLSSVGETAKRVVCQSNLRQIGLTLAMYADTNGDRIPPSVFLPPPGSRVKQQLEQMVTLRLEASKAAGDSGWDGLGVLYQRDFVSAPKLFYCPSHRGNHPFRRYADQFGISNTSEIVGNYHYRGLGPNESIELHGIKPESAAIVADGMRTRSDYNHGNGFNVLRASLAVEWVKDSGGRISSLLPAESGVGGSSTVTEQVWRMLDE